MMFFSPRIFGRRIRKTAKKLSLRRRHLRLTSNDQVRARRLKSLIIGLLVKIRITDKAKSVERFEDNNNDGDDDGSESGEQQRSDGERENLMRALKCCIAYYLSIITYEDEDHDFTPSHQRTISSFSPSQCNTEFRFLSAHLELLVSLLKFPDECILNNGIKMRGEEVLLRGLYELASGEMKHKVASHFGRDGTAQSRAFLYFINHIYDNFKHLVTDNLSWWFRNGFIKESASAIEAKSGVVLEEREKVGVFIDCNCEPTTRVGGGPADDGANSARWNPAIQRSFYNSWKSVDGLKHQTVNSAHGFCVDM